MSTIIIFSDLHLNFFKDNGASILNNLYTKDVDIGVCAGDLTTGANNLENAIIRLCDMYPQFVYVAGNHSYYGDTFKNIDDTLNTLESILPNFTWLNNKRKVVCGINFIGATLWFPETVAAQINKKHFSDFYCIEEADPEIFIRNEQTVEYFKQNIQAGDIVVTHHMLSHKCILPAYAGDTYNCFFVNDLDKLILEKNPAIAIMGHGHSNQNFMLGNTRLICNPHGYENENPIFDFSLVVSV